MSLLGISTYTYEGFVIVAKWKVFCAAKIKHDITICIDYMAPLGLVHVNHREYLRSILISINIVSSNVDFVPRS